MVVYLALKTPADLWVYQEIMTRCQPDLIIECGTHMGGSSLYLASMCQLLGRGRVVTIDINNPPGRPTHSLLTYIHGSSTDPRVVEQVTALARGTKRRMVILDSDHSRDHVRAEMEIYKEFVGSGDYLIVEDSIVNGNPILPDFGPGPMEAIQTFLPSNPDFTVDEACERLMATMNPRGFLRRN